MRVSAPTSVRHSRIFTNGWSDRLSIPVTRKVTARAATTVTAAGRIAIKRLRFISGETMAIKNMSIPGSINTTSRKASSGVMTTDLTAVTRTGERGKQ